MLYYTEQSRPQPALLQQPYAETTITTTNGAILATTIAPTTKAPTETDQTHEATNTSREAGNRRVRGRGQSARRRGTDTITRDRGRNVTTPWENNIITLAVLRKTTKGWIA